MSTTQEPADEFLRRYYKDEIGELAQHYPSEQQSLRIDWRELYRFDHDLADELLDDPEGVLRDFETALQQFDLPVDIDLSGASVRIHNCPDVFDPASVSRKANVDRYVSVSGQVSKTSKVKPKVVEAAWRCVRCGVLTRVDQDGGELRKPHECRSCERDGPFNLDQRESEFVDHQSARIQQPPEDTQGGNAEHVDVHLEDDVTGGFMAGDRVTVSGVLSLDTDDDGGPVFDTQVQARDLVREESDYEDVVVDEHLDEIQAIANGEYGDPYDLLRDSVHPTHQGDETIKLALGLQLFGGWAREYPNGKRDRGDSHILLLGDPGCGKSDLLEAVSNIAPRSVYTSGKGASAAGLTAAAVRDDFGDSEWGLEAGALVLADGGVACVDEIDKMEESAVSSMHEALEAQRVNISKAGINATLNARTSLLAAGNPKYGRFDQYQPMGEQIDLDPALISRFDLIFMISDEPDREEDAAVVGGMIEDRSTAGKYTLGEGLTDDEQESIEPPIPHDTLRAYIAYVKENVYPRIRDDEVAQRIQEYFVELRMANDDGGAADDNPVPVTYRKEKAIERFAEASARVRLSDTVEHEDVERAVHLVETSLRQVGRDAETGQFDADIIRTGRSRTQQDRIKTIETTIDELGGATLDDLDEELEDMGRGIIKGEVETLKEDGRIYNRGDDTYLTI